MSRPGDWRCTNCGDFPQFARNIACHKCCWLRDASPAAHGKVRDGDWKCTHCGDFPQFARNTQCRKCKTPKPVSADVPSAAAPSTERPKQTQPGDWICKDCGDLQFASRSQCRKCGQSKPASDDADATTVCLVCFAAIRNASFLHGDSTHTVCCVQCAEAIMARGGTCPLCRQQIERLIKSFS